MSEADKVNILVVDDLPEKLLVFQTVLEDLGQTVVTARSGREALRQTLDHDFAVILLDVNMPDMDGFETAELIRGRKKSALTPIIFVTGFADEMRTAKGYALGAVDYILSPVVPEILRTKVKVFVDLFRMTQQIKQQAEEHVTLAREQVARAAAEEATRRSAFLAEASKVLTSSLDWEATFRALARLAVPFLADLSAVTPVDDHARMGATELTWLGQGAESHIQVTGANGCLPSAWAHAVREVLAEGKARLLTDMEPWSPLLSAKALKPNGQPALSAPDMKFEPLLVLPLLARGRTLGLLTLARSQSGSNYTPEDVTFAEDLAGRAAIAGDNARLYQAIQEGDQRKNEFLAMLGHELRNPLAPIRNAVQLLRMIGSPEPRSEKIRGMIERQVTHMARLVDDLLDMSRISRGKILLKKEPLDLVELVRATVHDYHGSFEAAGLEVQVALPHEPIHLTGDATRLAQVVGNVLHNANKFTDAGGRVMIEVTQDLHKRCARIRIHDTGIGMEQPMLARLFETFSQADRSLDRSRGGLGLGLALVKALVDMHDGQVTAHSEGLGKGTEVCIELPLLEELVPANKPAAATGVHKCSYRILLIEDNADAAESMRMVLDLNGHIVEVKANGHEGVAAARRFQPQVVLCDIGLMGGMDGYAVARALRREEDLGEAYLIALTGYGKDEDRQRAHEAGFDLHLTKPIDPVHLEHLLATLPGNARSQPV